MKSWYRIEARSQAEAEIAIYDEIGIFGISAKKFIEDLKKLGNPRRLNVRINSPGGDVFDGIAIYNALKRHPATVVVTIDGLAASIASVIAMAGDKIVMPDNSMMMIHNPWGGVLGEAEDMREFADTLDKIKLSIIATYRRSGKTDEEIAALMDAETWYSAAEAKANGFADEVIESVDIAAFFDLSKYEKTPAALKAKADPKPDPTPNPAPAPAADDPEQVRATQIRKLCAEHKLEPEAESLIAKGLTVETVRTMMESFEQFERFKDFQKVRAEGAAAASQQAAEIVDACGAAGAPELASKFIKQKLSLDEVKAQLSDPEQLAAARASWISNEIAEIHQLCIDAKVPEMAAKFIARRMTVEQVKARLRDAADIRSVCAAAARHLGGDYALASERARRYIQAGYTIDEVRAELEELIKAQDELAGEIDNKLPDSFYYPNGQQRQSNAVRLDYKSIYSKRSSPAGTDLATKIARVIEEHKR
ncbi:MAG TPA: head maturation protease, ClpP-related [Methylomirabilota bacterium]|nr:head maturation protease, ClpP-related [Methylomirabilota bacterium]